MLFSKIIKLLLFFFSNFLSLQTWCIPGTVFFNLLGGAIFGMKIGFPICLFVCKLDKCLFTSF